MELKPPAPFLFFDLLYRGTPGYPSKRKHKRDSVRGRTGLAERIGAVSEGVLQGGRRDREIATDESNKKRQKMMNNGSQKPRVCEGLGHGAYAKDSRIEVDDGRHEELGLGRWIHSYFFPFTYRVWAMSQRPTRRASLFVKEIIGGGLLPRYFTVCYFDEHPQAFNLIRLLTQTLAIVPTHRHLRKCLREVRDPLFAAQTIVARYLQTFPVF
ncbi:hypothetical protein BJX63DRAFT_69192 [Aspergillus granulosus]|uniref:Uncharacterized protein n=1 Tax=Aspergillus granulosus TaxID=176169 RepID=A0ABR4HSA9_9EURO